MTAVAGVLASAAQFRDGDLVFRRGRDGISAMVLAGRQGSRFSHVGMVLLHQGQVFVIHAMPGDSGQVGGVRMESLGAFLDSAVASDAAVYRPTGLREEGRQRLRQQLLALQGRPFDYRFSLATPERVYCSELVLGALAAAGIPQSPMVTTVSLVAGPVVLPDALRRLPGLEPVAGE